ncbi:ROK family protein [Rathayibacter sp. YIM 133350]|uniref:ROK family protein n=1 Tax=Rathayibacter sp. YIM 133350 TaxID=3131992 RepID=UPI00307E28FB
MNSSQSGVSPQLLRTMNLGRLLEHAWNRQAFTATDAMSWTGLTRSTVIGVCDELVRMGWIDELDDARSVGHYTKGRPARRYALRERAGAVIGVEAGYDRISAIVADLRGGRLATHSRAIPPLTPHRIENGMTDAQTRRALVTEVVEAAVAASGMPQAAVLAITIGVPAPVDAAGRSPADAVGFWQAMNPGLVSRFPRVPLVTVENDANLAAIGEGSSPGGRGRDVDSFIAMLVSEGIGSGLMIDRRLVRGRRGGAGEMRFLDNVVGVGSPNGLAMLARQWAGDAIRSGTLPAASVLAQLDPATLDEHDVARAAAEGDDAATAIIARLSERLARICIVLGDLLDVDRIIVGGPVVDSLGVVIEAAAASLAASEDPTAPELVASELGTFGVGIGAVEHALGQVREHALGLVPATRDVA